MPRAQKRSAPASKARSRSVRRRHTAVPPPIETSDEPEPTPSVVPPAESPVSSVAAPPDGNASQSTARDRPAPTAKKSKKQSAETKSKETTKIPTVRCTPTLQTLFLAPDQKSVTWAPENLPTTTLSYFNRFHGDIPTYFSTPKAAALAAQTHGALSLFLHIGHIVLPKFQQSNRLRKKEEWFNHVRASDDEWVNMQIPLQRCWCDGDTNIVKALVSLSEKQRDGWKSPFIVVLAKKSDLERACDTVKYKDDFDLPVQIYIGRLLFELIACDSIQVLFEHLVPSVPHTPVPTVPTHPVMFERSPEVPQANGDSFCNVLRNAESTGYASLTDEQQSKIDSALSVNLYPYQKQTIRWMLDKENDEYALNDYFWEERSFTNSPHAPGGTFFYFPLRGELRLFKPPSVRGGMVTEEMGLGKTVEALAVVAAQKCEHIPVELDIDLTNVNASKYTESSEGIIQVHRLRLPNYEGSSEKTCDLLHGDEVIKATENGLRVRRWPNKTTLVVCPNSLIRQWEQEAKIRSPGLSVHVWEVPRRHSETDAHIPGSQLEVAVGEHAFDIVLATYEMVRSEALLSKIFWRRVILDEAQVTRRSSTQISKDMFNMRCMSRFLMTGTPLVASIDDLKGQLAFLKIWPFTLDRDGFWEAHVTHNESSNTNLLDDLLKVTMMRHSKGQNLGLRLPQRQYETIRVPISGSFRAIYYFILLSIVQGVEACEKTSDQLRDTHRLRVLFRQLILACLSPNLINLDLIDAARRQLLAFSDRRLSEAALDNQFPQMSPQEAILYVASGNADNLSKRNIDNSVLQEYLDMPIAELRDLVVSLGRLTAIQASRRRAPRLAALAAGGEYRLDTDSLAELRQLAVQEGLCAESIVKTWTRRMLTDSLRLHYRSSSNTTPEQVATSGLGIEALKRLIEKKEIPTCPVCLGQCENRLAVTKCGHLYCMECIVLLMEHESGRAGNKMSKCAMCRRKLSRYPPVEIVRSDGNEDTDAEENEEDKENDVPNSEENQKTDQVQEDNMADDEEISDWERPTGEELDRLFYTTHIAARFAPIGMDSTFPTIPRKFQQHLADVRQQVSPKILELQRLIETSDAGTKFCVVAGSVRSLRVVADYLNCVGIQCVGCGVTEKAQIEEGDDENSDTEDSDILTRFNNDPNTRVYLLSTTHASGLTLTAAQVVVFLEMLPRFADEVQAAARVHRIGQSKNVRIVRIVAHDTLEEHMVAKRGRITSVEEERRVLAEVSNQDATDSLLLRYFGKRD